MQELHMKRTCVGLSNLLDNCHPLEPSAQPAHTPAIYLEGTIVIKTMAGMIQLGMLTTNNQ